MRPAARSRAIRSLFFPDQLLVGRRGATRNIACVSSSRPGGLSAHPEQSASSTTSSYPGRRPRYQLAPGS
jgi:hypothetical protein